MKDKKSVIISLHSSDPINSSLPQISIPSAFLRVHVQFPSIYPSEPPIFDLEKTGMMSMASRTYISKKLMLISTQYASRDEFCLEACIRFLLGDSNVSSMCLELYDSTIVQKLIHERIKTVLELITVHIGHICFN
jgi:hypothetical protein